MTNRSRRFAPSLGPEVFAVEHDSLQVTWSHLPRARMTFEIAGRSFDVDATPPAWYRRSGGRRPAAGTGGPGAFTVEGLEPSTAYDVALAAPGYARRRVASAVTMGPPAGRLLSRFATVSDCHFGERVLGALHRLHDPVPRPPGLQPYPVRCASAALEQAKSWGASLVVAKGDLTQDGKHDEFETAVQVLREAGSPVAVTFGNHDVRGPVQLVEATRMLEAAGFTVADATRHIDLAGARLVLSHTPLPNRHAGRMDAADIEAAVAAAGDTDLPAIVIVHHPLRKWPVETHYPPSLRWRDSRMLASGLRGANPASIVLAGHTHRNRRYSVGGVTVVEVGSTKDYPGQWAGYSVYEGGIRQVVRRIERPDAIAWTQMTSRAMGGVWRRWSPGRMDDRCWSIDR